MSLTMLSSWSEMSGSGRWSAIADVLCIVGVGAVLLAGIPAAILLGAMGATYAPVGLAETGLGLLLAIPYVVGFVGGASGRLRVPSLSRERVR